MNIKKVKDEIKNTIKAYLTKDSFGEYKIPVVRQRPMLMIGPPGIGKTAIMEQVARECEIGLVSYTITHHTRQSAIGLPYIDKKIFDGKEYSVTEYTMSEIIASVFNFMKETGHKEGILFIDEINCVSETLAPTMLEFLQKKSFGNHKVPKGWVIVAAGNPPEYNKSVRDFDIVTLDRVKKIEVEADYFVWKEYAYKQSIHGAILSYLDIKKEQFYQIETTVDGSRFVTARGWEDLSEIMYLYEELDISIDEELIIQYLQHTKVAKDFANYYDLYIKYQKDNQIEDIFNGNISETTKENIRKAPFDEKLCVVGVLLSRLNESFTKAFHLDTYVTELYSALKKIQSRLLNKEAYSEEVLKEIIDKRREDLEQKKRGAFLDKREEICLSHTILSLEEYERIVKMEGLRDNESAFSRIRELFNQDVEERQNVINQASLLLDRAFIFMDQVFSESSEMVVFVTELTSNYYSMKFINEHGCDKYYEYSKGLLFREVNEDIRKEIANVRSIM